MTTLTPHTPRGALIAIEGLDRAGKSTQCDLLLNRLLSSGIPAKLQKFPDRTTPIGTMINSYLTSTSNLDDQAIHLLFSANRWEARDHLLSSLNSGTTLLLDRYIYSGIVFSAAKPPTPVQNPNPLSISWCKSPDIGLPRPDIIIFLNISQEDAEKRAGFGDERYEKRELQDKVRRLFEELRGEGSNDKDDWWVVDAGGTVEEVAEEVWKGVLEGLKRVKEGDGEVRSIE
ncbi:Thymidylate kinase [Orbilia oligospora]|uniref:Thymidylate kinase n=1 Tax=Orbilia oligospora TaxID=2813651 RepID=A0A7C8QDG0_ORBOL|nr:Thymidylate kinase [Orbilia oligospora]